MPLTVETMRGMLPRGGTVLGTRRGSPFDKLDGVDLVKRSMSDLGLEALIVIGGNGSLSVACRLHTEHGIPIVGVPKTIDNDIVGTDVTFGFNTAVQIATDAIDRLHTTAESHNRVMVVEVMGRHTGWIATSAGIAGGATAVLIPEIPFDIDELCTRLSRRHERGRFASIVVVAEGAEPVPGTLEMEEKVLDRFGHVVLGGVATRIAIAIGERTGFETCSSVMSSAAARPPRLTVCSRPGSALRRSMRCTKRRGARCRYCAVTRSCTKTSPLPSARHAPWTWSCSTESPNTSSPDLAVGTVQLFAVGIPGYAGCEDSTRPG
jgi:6-phosphofructokinase